MASDYHDEMSVEQAEDEALDECHDCSGRGERRDLAVCDCDGKLRCEQCSDSHVCSVQFGGSDASV